MDIYISARSQKKICFKNLRRHTLGTKGTTKIDVKTHSAAARRKKIQKKIYCNTPADLAQEYTRSYIKKKS